MNQRLMLYRKVAAARRDEELERVARGGARPLRPAARVGAEPGRLRPHPGHGRPARHRVHRPRRPHRRLKVQAAGEARSGVAVPGRAAAWRPHAGPAGGAEARPEEAAGRGTPARRRAPGSPSRRRSGRRRDAIRSPAAPGGRRGPRPARSSPGSRRTRSCGRPRKIRGPPAGVRSVSGLLRELSEGRLDRVKYCITAI